MHVFLTKENITKDNMMILCMLQYLELRMIGPFNSQFLGNHLALCMVLQTGLYCDAALAGPHIFPYLQICLA